MEYHRFFSMKKSGQEAMDLVTVFQDASKMISRLTPELICNKAVFKDMAVGIKILARSMSSKPQEAHFLFVDWLGLYLRIQKLIPSDNDAIRCKFEKTVPIAVSYILAATLEHRSKVPNYHVRVLGMLMQLLDDVTEQTLIDTARLEPENVFSLVDLIAFVSDFNAQMMAVRLLVKLLKYIDTQPNDLSKNSPREYMLLYERILGLTATVNYDEQNIYNKARDILNVYNMSSQNVCHVLSFSCKSMKLGEMEFFRETNSKTFWIDLNIKPKTLTCNCIAKTAKNYHSDVSIQIQISQIKFMSNNTVVIVFQEPANISGDIPEEEENSLEGVRKALIELDVLEMNRLKKNYKVLNCFNNNCSAPESMSSEPEIESTDLTYNSSCAQLLQEHNKATAQIQTKIDIKNTGIPNKPGVPTRNLSLLEINERRVPSQVTFENIMEGPVKNNSNNVDQKTVAVGAKSISLSEIKEIEKSKEIRQLSQTVLKTTFNAYKTVATDSSNISVSDINEKYEKNTTWKPNQRPLRTTSRRKSLAQKADSSDQSDSSVSEMNKKSKETTRKSSHTPPKNTSRQKTPTQKTITGDTNNNSVQKSKEISEIKSLKGSTQETLFKVPTASSVSDRRFFKAPRPSLDTKPIQLPSKMRKGAIRKRGAKVAKALPPIRKQVNKVNPMNHLAMCDGDPNEAAKEYVENGGYINITNFMENNESLSVYSDEQRQCILRNVQNISASIERSTQRFRKSDESMNGDNNNRDIYDDRYMSLSEAEPGISYRIFKDRNVAKTKKPKEVKRSTKTKRKRGKSTVVSEESKVETVEQTYSPVLPASIESCINHDTTPKSSKKGIKPEANYATKTYSNRRKVHEVSRTPMPPTCVEENQINLVTDGSFSSEIQCTGHERLFIDLTLFQSTPGSIQYNDDVFSKSPRISPEISPMESFEPLRASNALSEIFETQENQIPATQPFVMTSSNYDNNWHMQRFLSDHDQLEQQFPVCNIAATPPKQSNIDNVVFQNRSDNESSTSSVMSDGENINRDLVELPRSTDVQQVTTVQTSTSYIVSRKRRSSVTHESLSSNDVVDEISLVSTTLAENNYYGVPNGFPRAITEYQNFISCQAEEIRKEVNQKCDDTCFDKVINLTRRCCEEFHREQKNEQQTQAEIVKLLKLIESVYKSHEDSTERYKRRRFALKLELDELLAHIAANDWEKLYNEAAEELQACSNSKQQEIWTEFAKARIAEIQNRLQSFLSL